MGASKGLDELDEREIPYGFRGKGGRNLNGNWYLIIDDFRFELMCVPGRVISRSRSVGIAIWL